MVSMNEDLHDTRALVVDEEGVKRRQAKCARISITYYDTLKSRERETVKVQQVSKRPDKKCS
jgi:hypothetical protein